MSSFQFKVLKLELIRVLLSLDEGFDPFHLTKHFHLLEVFFPNVHGLKLALKSLCVQIERLVESSVKT